MCPVTENFAKESDNDALLNVLAWLTCTKTHINTRIS